MNIKNSKIKNNNLQKPLPNTVTIFLFILDCAFFSSFSFYILSNFFKLTKISLVYVNIKPERIIPKKKKNYLKYDIGMKSRVENVTNNL